MLTPAIEKFLDKTIQILKDDTIKKKIQILILQPFIQYLIELIFPYLVILLVVFATMIVMITSILYLLLFKEQGLWGLYRICGLYHICGSVCHLGEF